MAEADDRRIRWALISSLTMAFFVIQGPTNAAQHKRVTGYIETIRIQPDGLTLRAKIDTGAENASVNAKNIEKFTRDGEPWVRFSLTNQENRSITIEGPVHRVARIRQHGGGVKERDVLMLGICLGTVFRTVEVNLADRAGFDFQMLIGRSFLGGDFIVDPSERFLLEPNCPQNPH